MSARGRRTQWIVTGLFIVFAITAILYRRSGLAASARDLPQAVADARAAGIEPDAGVLVRRERSGQRVGARKAYEETLVRFGRRLPSSIPVRDLEPSQRAALRPEIERLVPPSLAAEGGVARNWEYGGYLRFPDLGPARGAVTILLADARDARSDGHLDAALTSIEIAERLGHGFVGDRESLSESFLIGRASAIGRELAALLADSRLDKSGVERVRRIVAGPTFQHPDDHHVLSHDLAISVASVGQGIIAPPMRMLRSPDPVDRYAPLGRLKSVRYAWQDSLVRPYADVATALPQDWTDFDRYEAAWKIFERPAYVAPGPERLYARVFIPGAEGQGQAQMGREAIRRVLVYACDRRQGATGPPPRDPFSKEPLIVRESDGKTVIYSRFRDRKDDGGAPYAKGQGDFAVTIPR